MCGVAVVYKIGEVKRERKKKGEIMADARYNAWRTTLNGIKNLGI
jgi:hypothetical protein